MGLQKYCQAQRGTAAVDVILASHASYNGENFRFKQLPLSVKYDSAGSSVHCCYDVKAIPVSLVPLCDIDYQGAQSE